MSRRIILFLLVIAIIIMTPVVSVADSDDNNSDMRAQTSGVYSQWSSTPYNYTTYNCYGYAIGTNQNINPGYYSGSTFHNITTLKTAVKKDLNYLGYSDVRFVTKNYYLQPGERLLCVVYGFWYEINAKETPVRWEGYDYHFYVKYTNGGGWFHKAGRLSAVMKLRGNYTPSTIQHTDEKYTSSTVYVPAQSCCYSPNIAYIVYQTGIPVTSVGNESLR